MFKRVARLGTALVLLVALWPQVPIAYGILGSCQADVDVHLVTQEAQTRFAFTFDDVSSIQRITINRPSAEFTINGATGESWNASNSNEEAVFIRGGPVASVIYVDALSGTSDASPADWIVTASDDIGGADAIDCLGGNLTTEISGSPIAGDTTGPVISNIFVTGLTTSTATINWTTDEPATTQINYGLNELDESFVSDTLTTAHSVALDSLQAGLTYYYFLSSKDASDNESTTGTNTFITKTTPTIAPNVTTVAKPGSSDLVPPTVTFDKVGGVFQSAPTFTGTASDNIALAAIEYSVDGGKNWLPADEVVGLGSVAAQYRFSPINLEDGDYIVLVRARDTADNSVVSEAQTVTIDALDPFIGGYVLYAGSQPLYPNGDGAIITVVNAELDLSVNAIGGATSVSVIARQAESGQDATFSLVDQGSDNLWTGKMLFSKAGVYQVRATSRDGGGNISTRELATIRVQSPATITDGGQSVKDATVTVFYQDIETKTWNEWDGSVYSQSNPVVVGDDATYSFLLPEGKYYIKVQAKGYRATLSNIFDVYQPTVIGANTVLKKRPGFSLGGLQLRLPWPSFKPTLDIQPGVTSTGVITKDATLPPFSLRRSDGQTVSTVSILGKPTVLSLVSPWSLTARQQISVLDTLPQDQVNVIAVGSGQNLSRLTSYARLAGFDAGLVADTENQLINGLSSGLTPTTYFIDRQGVVKSMSSKVLSEEEIINNVPF
ncbi:MAG: redoxin domain-containing protein [Candidatus Saccharibacteria bacterium]|nr:redoxin domain-containing protein [Candidatus Saccharibacteria bacterium]